MERKERAVVRRVAVVLGGRWALLGVAAMVRGVDMREMVRERERERDDEGDKRRGRKVKEGGAEKVTGWMQEMDMEGVALSCRGAVGVRSGGGQEMGAEADG